MVVNLPTVDVIKVLVGEDFLARAVKTDEYFINGAVKITSSTVPKKRGAGWESSQSFPPQRFSFQGGGQEFPSRYQKIAFPYEFGDKFCFG